MARNQSEKRPAHIVELIEYAQLIERYEGYCPCSKGCDLHKAHRDLSPQARDELNGRSGIFTNYGRSGIFTNSAKWIFATHGRSV